MSQKYMFSYLAIAEKSLFVCRCLAILIVIVAPVSTATTSIVCIVMLCAWLISGQAWHSLKISAQQPVGKALLLFFAWLIVSSMYAETLWAGRLVAIFSWKKLFYTFVLLGLFGQAEWKKRFIYCYIGVMFLAAVAAIFLWLLHIRIRHGCTAGIFMTNYTAQSLAFVTAMLGCIFLLKESLSSQKKWLLVGMITVFLFNIFFISQSRSGYQALPVAVIFAFVIQYGYKKIPYILGATVIVFILLASTSDILQKSVKLALKQTVTYQTSKKYTSIGARLIYMQNTWELIEKQPVLGYGTSSFKRVYSDHVAAKYKHIYKDWRRLPMADPHNQYLFVWLENGLIGLLLFLAYIYAAIRQGIQNQPYGAIAASVIVAISSTSLFNSHFKTFQEGHLLAFFIGCLLAQQSTRVVDKGKA